MRPLLLVAAVAGSLAGLGSAVDVFEYAKCQLCETAKPSGAIDDCCCDVETVDQVNTRHFLPILHELTKRTYFRYFQVDLWRQCPYWPDDGECAREECAVCECDEKEVPACWREEEGKARVEKDRRIEDIDEDTDKRAAQLSRVHYGSSSVGGQYITGTDSHGQGQSSARAAGYDEANVWSEQTGRTGADSAAQFSGSPSLKDSADDLQFVNLLENPEGYTAYAGPKAARIWGAIYGENCFTGPLEGMCLEERVFYRLISGLQTSINTHIAMTYGGGEGSEEGKDMYSERAAGGGKAAVVGQATAKGLLGRLYTGMLNLASRAGGHGPFPAVPEAYAPGNGNGNWGSAAAGASSVSAPAVTSSRDSGGRHSSIPSAVTHIANLVLTRGLKPNVTLYHERIGSFPDRQKNLYFAFLFVVRAVAKARPLLEALDFSTGNATDDAETHAAVTRLLDVEVPSVLAGFDESVMFRVTTTEFLAGGKSGAGHDTSTCPPVLHGLGDVHDLQYRYLAHVGRKTALREAFRDKYRNISRIMDCVGCEKCRLWGKLQFLGLGTAMKILFADADASTLASHGPYAQSGGRTPSIGVHLSRNELVALVNVLHRLSMSLAALHVMRDLEARERLSQLLWSVATPALVTLLLFILLVRRVRRPALK